jgi:hypothetical protein
VYCPRHCRDDGGIQTSELLVTLYQSAQCYNPQDNHFHTHRCENLILLFFQSFIYTQRSRKNQHQPHVYKTQYPYAINSGFLQSHSTKMLPSLCLWFCKHFLGTLVSSAVAYGSFLWQKNWFIKTFIKLRIYLFSAYRALLSYRYICFPLTYLLHGTTALTGRS